MTTKHFFLTLVGVATIIGVNVALAQRDQRMLEAYDQACAQLPIGHPDCIFAKTK